MSDSIVNAGGKHMFVPKHKNVSQGKAGNIHETKINITKIKTSPKSKHIRRIFVEDEEQNIVQYGNVSVEW